MTSVLDVTGPADDQLLTGGLERAETAYHGGVSVADGDGPFGGQGGVASFWKGDGFSLGLDSEAIDDGGVNRWGLRGAWEVALRRAMREGRYDGKIVTYVEATT